MIDQETRDLALKTFRDTLNDPLAKPSDKLRAAEAIARMEVSEREDGRLTDLDAADHDLLRIARGGDPKRTGPSDAEMFARGEITK